MMKKTNYYEICHNKLQYLGYSENTSRIYLHYINQFLEQIGVSPSKLTSDHFQNYLETYSFTSRSQQNQVINAIGFLYKHGLKKKYNKVSFQRPRAEKKLPRIIDHDLIIEKLGKIQNLKHKTILTLTYSVGLRISEVVNMKLQDIDSGRMIIHIKNAKGRKDRIVPLSPVVLNILREYYKEYKPKIYLFNGQNNQKYSVTSCREIAKKLLSKEHRFHDIRHSFATHLVDQDTNLSKIASLLGHKSTKTTEIYVHVSQKALKNVSLPI